jgi:ATP-dependent Clp protease protease subunit
MPKRKNSAVYAKAEEDVEEEQSSPSNIHVTNNHIYFYEDVTKKSTLDLIATIQELIKENKKIAIDLDLQEIPPIYLHINSPGGLLIEAFAIIDIILNSPVKIISIIEGQAASAATLISVVCEERWIRPNATMLIHELRGGNCGKYSEIETDMDNLSDMMTRLKDIYLCYTKLTNKDLTKILPKDRDWNAEKCKKFGLVDLIVKN